MIAALARQSYVSPRCAFRRLLIGVLILTAVGGLWRLCQPFLVVQLAESSVGCPGRGPLLAAGLRQIGQSLPDDTSLFEAGFAHEEQDLRTHSLPRPGWVAWYAWERRQAPDSASKPLWLRTLSFADADLRTRGSLTWDSADEHIDWWCPLAGPPADYDGDGAWEILLRLGRGFESGVDSRVGYAVVRAANELNQVCAYIVIDTTVWSKPRPSLRVLWRDIGGDGASELTLVSVKRQRDSAGRLRLDPPQIHAVFTWTRPAGTLVPQKLPPEGGVYVHTFVADDLAAVPSADDIAPILRRLRPTVPDSP